MVINNDGCFLTLRSSGELPLSLYSYCLEAPASRPNDRVVIERSRAVYHSGRWASQMLIQARRYAKNQRRSLRVRRKSLAVSGIEFIKLDGCVEKAYQTIPGIADDRQKDLGVEEIADQDELHPIHERILR